MQTKSSPRSRVSLPDISEAGGAELGSVASGTTAGGGACGTGTAHSKVGYNTGARPKGRLDLTYSHCLDRISLLLKYFTNLLHLFYFMQMFTLTLGS